jgi:hypothetical protein
VQRVAQAGYAAVFGHHGGRVLAIPDRFEQQPRGMLHRADEHASQAAEARSDRRLHRFRRAKVSEPRRERARRHAVLDQGHGHGVEEPGLVLVRRLAGELEPRHVAQAQGAEDLARQVLAAHDDALARGPAEIATNGIHGSPPLRG